jgi:hypothetical protein
MFGVKTLIPAGQMILARFHFPVLPFTVNPFSLWAMYGGWVATGTIAGLIVTIKLVGLLVVQGEYVDPFTRYETILPGQPMSALTAYNCLITQPRINGRTDTTHFSCSLFPQDGSLDIVHVDGINDSITELTFYAANLNLGHVLLHWKPFARPTSNGTSIDWNSDTYSISVIESKFDYQVPFRMFSIKRQPRATS